SIHGTAADTVWTIDVLTKTLEISGNGSAGDWKATAAPWYQFRGYFENVSVENGVTDLGDYSFYSYKGVKSIVMADSVARIGANSLRGCSSLEKITFGAGLMTVGSNALTGYSFQTDGGKPLKLTAEYLAGKTFHLIDGRFVSV
ncbi:MAG: leucine-rich repeat domain-containing protein, partial [archaeon]|nr:leucine-rich repeat domain-containing protein [archaeon]